MRSTTQRRWVFLAAIALLAGIVACSELPDPARIDNPFDPNVGAGDPFDVRVSFEKGSVIVRWNPIHVSQPGILSYLVSHSAKPSGPFRLLGEVVVAPNLETKFAHASYTRDSYNYYIVQARKADGISAESIVAAMGIRTAPTVRLTSGLETTGTRTPVFLLRPRIVSGEAFELSLDPAFSAISSFDSAEVADDVVFDLGPASRSAIFRLYSRVRRGGVVDTTGVDSVFADLRTRMSARLNTMGMIDDTLLTLDLSNLEGVTLMRFARSGAGLAGAAWETPDPDLESQTHVLSLDVNEVNHEIFGEFESDFGFRETKMLELMAQINITSVGFSLVNSGGSTGTTAELDILVIPAAVPGARYMRFSEDVSFPGVAWQPFASSAPFTLSPALGDKTVFGQFRNPFSNTVASQATITLTDPTP
jgi:hypothetical protein